MLNLKWLAILVTLALWLGINHSAIATSADNGPCALKPNWLSRESVPEPKPEDFPENPNNCDFHQISWQYFLWLTEKVSNGKLRFETLYSEDAIKPESQEATNTNLHLVFQAGSLGILVDPHGRATYTSIMLNKTYRDFVLKNELYDSAKLQQFPAGTPFPVGSLSLKASWKIVGKDEDVSRFYTTHADIYKLDNVNGEVNFPATPDVEKNVKVALVGLHIAAVVKHHPEAIWATFEHLDNAPNMLGILVDNDPDKLDELVKLPVSEKNYTFYQAKELVSECNVNNAKKVSLNKETQQLTPTTQVCRQYAHGGGKSANQNNIEAINISALLQLNSNSVWRNYAEIGAVWLLGNDALIPNWNPNLKPKPAITGSVTLSSSVIETFTQNVDSQNNCFSCHNTMPLIETPPDIPILPGKNVSTSHIVLQHYVKGAAVNR